MNDKSQGHNSDKGSGHDKGHGKPDRERGSNQDQHREKGGGHSQQGSGGGEFQQMDRGNRNEGADASDYRDRMVGKQDAEFSDYRNQAETDRLAAEAAKKAGCLPKLFVLLMPFVALGTYLVVRS